MTIQEQLKIYDTLMINYQPGDSVWHTDLICFLKNQPEPIVCNDYGFSSPLKFTKSLSFLEHEPNYPHPDVAPRWRVTIGERPVLNAQEKEAIRQEAIRQEIAAESEEKKKLPDKVVDTDDSLPLLSAEEMKEIGLPATLNEEIVNFRLAAQQNLKRFLLGDPDNQEPLTDEEKRKVFADYAAAYLNGKVYLDRENGNTYMIRLSMKAKDGSPLKLNIGKSAAEFDYPWYVKYAGRDRSSAKKRPVSVGDALYNFAYLGNEDDFYNELIEQAQPECWSFTGEPGDHTILFNYLRYTFARLQQQDKICFDNDGQFAAFNTGLLSRRQGEDLFAYFVPNPNESSSPWKFVCFCSADSDQPLQRKCYKNMYAQFNEPPIATYFTKISDLLFDPSGEVSISYDHIIRDNADRFDLDFLEDLCRHNAEGKRIIANIRDTLDQQHREKADRTKFRELARKVDELFRELGDLIADTPRLASPFKDHLDGEVERAYRRAARNYKYAVPCFYPARGVMSILLPLTCAVATDEEEPKPNLVLVCERTVSGDYIGQTVFDLPMAYVDARLLCAPESEWLNPTRIASISSSPVWNVALADQLQQQFGDPLTSVEEEAPDEDAEPEYPEM